MKLNICRIFIVLCMLSIAGLAQADTVFDDFNRPDGAVGSNWTIRDGSFEINNDALLTLEDLSLMTYNGIDANGASVDVLNPGTNPRYVGIVLGYADLDDNIFIKVQSYNNADFNFAAFYFGNNGSGSYFSIDPFRTARIAAGLYGDEAVLLIDSNFDGVAEQTFWHTYSSSQIASLGTGVGLAGYGSSRMDNFLATGEPVPEPASLTLLGTGLGLVGIVARRKRK